MSYSRTTIEPLSDEDMKSLGLAQASSLCEAVQVSNNVPVNQLYDSSLDMNSNMVGWNGSISDNPIIQKLFSKQTIRTIQQKTSEYLVGLDPNGKRIIPSERVVEAILYGVYRSHRPETGDIYGKYLVNNMNMRNDYAYIVDKCISLLVRGIRDELETEQNNEKLSIWTTVLGDFNEHGLRQYAPIKIREKRPDNFQFHMRY